MQDENVDICLAFWIPISLHKSSNPNKLSGLIMVLVIEHLLARKMLHWNFADKIRLQQIMHQIYTRPNFHCLEWVGNLCAGVTFSKPVSPLTDVNVRTWSQW